MAKSDSLRTTELQARVLAACKKAQRPGDLPLRKSSRYALLRRLVARGLLVRVELKPLVERPDRKAARPRWRYLTTHKGKQALRRCATMDGPCST